MLEHILPDWLRMEQSLAAFMSGDKSMLLWSILNSPQSRSYDQAVAVLEDLLAMEGHEELQEHYGFPPNW